MKKINVSAAMAPTVRPSVDAGRVLRAGLHLATR
jgi:hypothetical protein